MNVERLEKVAAFLKTYEPKEKAFNMELWGCGTAACAVGSAIDNGVTPGLEWDNSNMLPCYRTGDYTYFSWMAVQLYFDISAGEALQLFSSHEYRENPTPKDVARRIRIYIAAKSS